MMFWTAIAVTVIALVHCSTTPSGETFTGETEWDCSNDHAPSPDNPRNFLQSPNGFGEGAAVFEVSCPTRLQVFSQIDGLCRCLYTPELRALLEQPCQIRPLSGIEPVEYDILIPNKDVETIEQLYERRSCNAVLPQNIIDFFVAQGVQPLYFDTEECGCKWTQAALEIRSRPIGQGQKCERLVDTNFTGAAVSSDEVGNWIDVFPYARQNNMTVSEGGSVFGGGDVTFVMWRLAALDFTDISLVAHFRPSSGTQNQLLFTNICADTGGTGGFVELQYNPNGRRYQLQFFGQSAECSPQNAPGGFADQVANVIYRNGVVRLEVNGFDCDVSALNAGDRVFNSRSTRLQFSSECPFQLGGAVFTDITQADFGRVDSRVTGFEGIYMRFLVTRDCANPPQMVLDRILGNV